MTLEIVQVVVAKVEVEVVIVRKLRKVKLEMLKKLL